MTQWHKTFSFSSVNFTSHLISFPCKHRNCHWMQDRTNNAIAIHMGSPAQCNQWIPFEFGSTSIEGYMLPADWTEDVVWVQVAADWGVLTAREGGLPECVLVLLSNVINSLVHICWSQLEIATSNFIWICDNRLQCQTVTGDKVKTSIERI